MANTIIDQTFVKTIKFFFGHLGKIAYNFSGILLKIQTMSEKKNTEGA